MVHAPAGTSVWSCKERLVSGLQDAMDEVTFGSVSIAVTVPLRLGR